MTYRALLTRLQKMTPAQLRQPVKLKEGCSDNVTTVGGCYLARTDEYWYDCVDNEGDKPDANGCTSHMEKTDRLMFKKGQIWLLHDH